MFPNFEQVWKEVIELTYQRMKGQDNPVPPKQIIENTQPERKPFNIARARRRHKPITKRRRR